MTYETAGWSSWCGLLGQILQNHDGFPKQGWTVPTDPRELGLMQGPVTLRLVPWDCHGAPKDRCTKGRLCLMDPRDGAPHSWCHCSVHSALKVTSAALLDEGMTFLDDNLLLDRLRGPSAVVRLRTAPSSKALPVASAIAEAGCGCCVRSPGHASTCIRHRLMIMMRHVQVMEHTVGWMRQRPGQQVFRARFSAISGPEINAAMVRRTGLLIAFV